MPELLPRPNRPDACRPDGAPVRLMSQGFLADDLLIERREAAIKAFVASTSSGRHLGEDQERILVASLTQGDFATARKHLRNISGRALSSFKVMDAVAVSSATQLILDPPESSRGSCRALWRDLRLTSNFIDVIYREAIRQCLVGKEGFAAAERVLRLRSTETRLPVEEDLRALAKERMLQSLKLGAVEEYRAFVNGPFAPRSFPTDGEVSLASTQGVLEILQRVDPKAEAKITHNLLLQCGKLAAIGAIDPQAVWPQVAHQIRNLEQHGRLELAALTVDLFIPLSHLDSNTERPSDAVKLVANQVFEELMRTPSAPNACRRALAHLAKHIDLHVPTTSVEGLPQSLQQTLEGFSPSKARRPHANPRDLTSSDRTAYEVTDQMFRDGIPTRTTRDGKVEIIPAQSSALGRLAWSIATDCDGASLVLDINGRDYGAYRERTNEIELRASLIDSPHVLSPGILIACSHEKSHAELRRRTLRGHEDPLQITLDVLDPTTSRAIVYPTGFSADELEAWAVHLTTAHTFLQSGERGPLTRDGVPLPQLYTTWAEVGLSFSRRTIEATEAALKQIDAQPNSLCYMEYESYPGRVTAVVKTKTGFDGPIRLLIPIGGPLDSSTNSLKVKLLLEGLLEKAGEYQKFFRLLSRS